ncbi:hypothetical protein DP939_15965 [Spongiactinospora rosea]|uniref:Amidohydrolase family protein n=1 Tax=Spongiactinospora rosea TaxID=2248750 RepID=A0A366M1V3_9ACTN|nr:hypothetical protein DP939_15965 [Spongiactinospora rosea]
MDHVTGSLERSTFADLIVLNRDVPRVPAEQIAGTRVLLTLVGGKTVRRLPFNGRWQGSDPAVAHRPATAPNNS